MNGFKTLLWREWRSAWGWAVGLIASLGGWTTIVISIQTGQPEDRFILRTLVLVAAGIVGMIILAFMAGRLHQEMKRGENRVLILSPVRGWVHIVTRLALPVGVGWAYLIGLGIIEWWAFGRLGAHLRTADVLQLALAYPSFIAIVFVLPSLAWVLLLVMFVSAFRLSRLGWLAAVAMFVGTPTSLIYSGVNALDHHLPTWHFTAGVTAAMREFGMEGSIPVPGIVHSGDIVGAILLTMLLVFLAGRLWEEVEG